MNTAVINIKVEPRVKKEAQEIAREMGLSLSGVVHGFLKQLVKTRTVTFSANEEPTEYLLKALKESKEDIRAGRVMSFQSIEKEHAYIDKLIENDKKHKKS